jgi:hypothetical protein
MVSIEDMSGDSMSVDELFDNDYEDIIQLALQINHLGGTLYMYFEKEDFITFLNQVKKEIQND